MSADTEVSLVKMLADAIQKNGPLEGAAIIAAQTAEMDRQGVEAEKLGVSIEDYLEFCSGKPMPEVWAAFKRVHGK